MVADPAYFLPHYSYRPGKPLPPKDQLPTMDDLPSEDPEDPGLPDEFHFHQPRLLWETFYPPTCPEHRRFSGVDMYLYYDPDHPLWYKRPDWFAVLDVRRFHGSDGLRSSYVVWQEDVVPFIAIELLSPGTEQEDLGKTVRDTSQPPTKWQVYETLLGIPYYAVYSQTKKTLRVFQNDKGRYRELAVGSSPLWLSELQLGLGPWQGVYAGIEREWLRWFDADRQPLPTADERRHRESRRAEQAEQRAEQAEQRAEQAEQRAEQERQRIADLEAQLRAAGIEPKE